jgi:hypothetical protein
VRDTPGPRRHYDIAAVFDGDRFGRLPQAARRSFKRSNNATYFATTVASRSASASTDTCSALSLTFMRLSFIFVIRAFGSCGCRRRTHDDRRHGTTSLFAALDVATGQVVAALHGAVARSSSASFSMHGHCPGPSPDCTSSWITGTHKTPLMRVWSAKRPRYHMHFTPTYGSWLNLVERRFAELTNKQPRRACTAASGRFEAAPSSRRRTRTASRSSGRDR